MKIGFIDFSKDERNKVLATLQLLGEQNAIDELGVGTVRDAYADILFPGISTLQTRAKYFVLIPYLFSMASKQNLNSGREMLRWIQDKEEKIVEPLLMNSDNKNGIVGSTAFKRKRAVKMKPSTMYWNGLRTFEILKNQKVSLSAAANIAFANNKSKSDIKDGLIKDGDGFDDQTAANNYNILFSPLIANYNVEKDIEIELTNNEAGFLEYKITTAILSKKSLLAFLIKNKIQVDSFQNINDDILPHDIRKDYLLAKDFSDFIYGAHIRYNCIFSEYTDEKMEQMFQEWRSKFLEGNFDLKAILHRIIANYEISSFCSNFLQAVHDNDIKKMDELIIAREKAVKGSRSKLCKPSEYRYNPGNPIHNYKLDYRYGTAKTIISDIINGLERKDV